MLETISIIDESSGARASVLPALGFNCFSFQPVLEGAPAEVLWADEELNSGMRKPTHSGIPILSPFCGRIGGTSFRYEGREYSLDVGDDWGNAIHGLVVRRPWRVIERSASRTVGQFQASRDDPGLRRSWPADFRISVAYEVIGNRLRIDAEVENPDDRPLPFGLGLHPYFRVPLGPAGWADECIVTVPAHSNWELEGLRPTGRSAALPAGDALARGIKFGEMKLDNVLGTLDFTAGLCTSTIVDPHGGRKLSLTFGEAFGVCVVYNPPHREAVCIEPYTTLPDPFNLLEAGIDPGLRTLPPGERFLARVEIAVS